MPAAPCRVRCSWRFMESKPGWTSRPSRSNVKPLLRRLLVLAFVPVAVFSGCGGGSGDADPESARCTSPNATFGDAARARNDTER